MSARSIFGCLTLLFAAITPAAWAKPSLTAFKDLTDQSETIVVAVLAEPLKPGSSTAQLNVLQVLKGSLKPGKREVILRDDPYREVRQFVAFLDKNGVWGFMAVPAFGKPVEIDVLEVRGLSTNDAQFVTPGLVTLAQLKTYLNDKSLRYAFRGDLYFPQPGKPAWQASTLRLTGTYDAMAASAHVKGMPKLSGFPAEPKVYAGSFPDGASIDLDYSRHGYRPLQLSGKVVGVDPKSGEFQVRFALRNPTLLTQYSLEAYLADARRGPCYYTFRLKCAPTKGAAKPRELTLIMGKEIGTIGQIEGWENRSLEIAQAWFYGPSRHTSCATAEVPNFIQHAFARDCVLRMAAPTDKGRFLILAFELGEPPLQEIPLDFHCDTELLYGVWRGRTRGTLQLHDGKALRTITTFTVALDPVAFGTEGQQ